MNPAADTLRSRLTRATLWPSLLVVAASGVFDYRSAVDLAQKTQDTLLFKTASALAARMSPDEPGESRSDILAHLRPEDGAMLRADRGDNIQFLVLDGDGSVLVGDRTLSPLVAGLPDAPVDEPAFADRVINGDAVRAVSLTHTALGVTFRYLVTETNHNRAATTRRILLSTLWPNLLLLAVMVLLLQRGIHTSLAPLQALGRAIDRREPSDLGAIPQERVLGEIRPLVTAINRLLQRAQEAAAEQQMFLSGAAHQLRTPLAGIQTQLDLAAHDASPEVRARLGRIHTGIGDLAHTTQQMLALARASARATAPQDFTEVDLATLLEDAASTWLDFALDHNAALDFDIQPARCNGSRWMLQELLGNLIHNAIQHGEGGKVTIRCGRTQAGAPFVEVEDEGPGIPADEQAKVFEPFFRGARTRAPGSGLGLAIVREVALRHDARVELLSVSRSTGVRIRVTFGV